MLGANYICGSLDFAFKVLGFDADCSVATVEATGARYIAVRHRGEELGLYAWDQCVDPREGHHFLALLHETAGVRDYCKLIRRGELGFDFNAMATTAMNWFARQE